MMLQKKALSKEEAEAKTSVLWDMDSFPVPCGYDAGRIRQCIERALEKLGYSGPVTISACGDLHQTPEHLLRALSSTGIILSHSFNSIGHLYDDSLTWERRNPPPATIMVIALPGDAYSMYRTYSSHKRRGYTIIVDYEWLKLIEGARDSESSHNKQEITTRQFILEKCSKSSESSEYAPFYCNLCYFPAQSVESFTTHLSCEKHLRREFQRLRSISKDVEMTNNGVDQASLDSYPKTATTMVMEPPKKKIKTMKNCTILPPPKTLVEANKVKKKLKKKNKKLMKKLRTEWHLED